MSETMCVVIAVLMIGFIIVAPCVQLYDLKHNDPLKNRTSRTDARRAKEAALREAANQSLRLNLMAMDAARKMSEAAAKHKNSDDWSQF